MSKRSSPEIKEALREMENQGFSELRKRARDRQDQLYVTPAYKNSLVAPLPDRITERVPLAGRKLNNAARQIQSIIRTSVQFHVEAASKLKDDAKIADRLELMFAHICTIVLELGGRASADTWRHQTVSPVAGWWLEWDPFILPEKDEERTGYRKRYSPFKLIVPDPLSLLWLPGENGQPTMAGREFELPYIEIAKRYGDYSKGKDPDPLRILQSQFGFLRGGRGQSIDALSDVSGKKAKVCVLDDGTTISHYIQIKAGEYEQAGKDEKSEIPNPWGCPSLRLIMGSYNADAEKLVDRYEPLIEDMAVSSRNHDTVNSLTASIALHPLDIGEELPENIAAILAEGGEVAKTVFDPKTVIQLRGKMAELPIASPEGMAMLREETKDAEMATSPSPFLTNPDSAVVKSGAATSQMQAHETANRLYDDARQSYLDGINWVCKAIVHFTTNGYLNKKGQPKAANESLFFRVTGKEPTKKYRGDEKGNEIEISPDDLEDFDELYTLEITPLPQTESQKKVHYDRVRQEVQDGVSTLEDLIETQYEDVSGQITKLELARRYQAVGPIIDRLDLLASIEAIRLHEGRDYTQLALATGLLQGAQVADTQPIPGQDQGGDGMMMRPPPLSETEMSGVG